MAYTALYRQWRPQSFAELVGQEHISKTLINALEKKRIGHAYLFCGTRGTGKTSTAKILAKSLNCQSGPTSIPCQECENCIRITQGNSMDVLEIDAASNRGIDEIRDLRDKIKFMPVEGRYKIYIIDEVHMLTTEAFNALLKTIEEPPSHVVFVLATTEPHKIPATILSRCQRFDFHRISLPEMIKHMENIAKELEIKVTPEALRLIGRLAEGGMRDALSLLDQCISFGGEEVTGEDVLAIIGGVPEEILDRFVTSISEGDIAVALLTINEMVNQGKDLRLFLQDLMAYFRDVLLVQTCQQPEGLVTASEIGLNNLKKHGKLLSNSRVLDVLENLAQVDNEMKWSAQPRLLFEMAIIRLTTTKRKTTQEAEEHAVLADSTSLQSQAKSFKPIESKPSSSEINKKNQSQSDEVNSVLVSTSANLDIDVFKKNWLKVLEQVKKTKITTHAFLQEAKPTMVKNGALYLVFPKEMSFHKNNVDQPESKQIIIEAIEKAVGIKTQIKVCHPEDITNENSQSTTDKEDDFLAATKKMFDPSAIMVTEELFNK